MKKIKIVGLLVYLAACLSGCATAKAGLEEAAPSAGKAIVYLANLDVSHVDEKKVGWMQSNQYEITAGTHSLRCSYISGYDWKYRETTSFFTTTGSFEEGKTYVLIADGHKGAGIIDKYTYSSALEIIEPVQPQSRITLDTYKNLSVLYIKFSPDGSMVVAPHYQNKALDIYNVMDGTLIKRLAGHSSTVLSAIWCADGSKIVSSDLGGTIKIWNTSTGGEILSIQGQKNTNTRVLAATQDGTNVVGFSDSVLKVWNIVNGKEQVSINGYEEGIAVSPDGQYFAAGFKDSMRVYPINGGEPVFTIGEHSSKANAYTHDIFTPLAFKDNKTILASRSRTTTEHQNIIGLVTVDIDSGEIVTLQNPLSVSQAAYSADGKKIISTSASSVRFSRILDVKTGVIVSKIALRVPNLWGIIFDVSPTENKIAALYTSLVSKKFEYSVCFWEFE